MWNATQIGDLTWVPSGRDASEDRPVAILVHGTNDGCEGQQVDPARWYSSNSHLVQMLKTPDPNGNFVDVEVFRWSGANLESQRAHWAGELRRKIKAHGSRPMIIIAHSHGGNVVRRAMAAQHFPSVRMVVAIGTPFFHYDSVQRFWNLAPQLLLALLLAVPGVLGLAYCLERIQQASIVELVIVAALSLAGLAIACLIALMTALQILTIFEDDDSPPQNHDQTRWFNVCSKNDEAFLLLNFVAGRMTFGQRSDGRELFRPYIFGTASAAMVAVLAAIAFANLPLRQQGIWLDSSSTALEIAFVSAAIAALVLLMFALGAVIYGLLRKVSVGLRLTGVSALEEIAAKQVRKAAFGDDDGFCIAGVSLHPWNRVGEELPLSKAIHDELEAQASASSADAISQLRRLLSEAKSVTTPRRWDRFLEVLTWNELVHTLYLKTPSACLLIDELVRSHLFSSSPTPTSGFAEESAA